MINQEQTWTLDGQTVLFRRATKTVLQGDLYVLQPGGAVDPATVQATLPNPASNSNRLL